MDKTILEAKMHALWCLAHELDSKKMRSDWQEDYFVGEASGWRWMPRLVMLSATCSRHSWSNLHKIECH